MTLSAWRRLTVAGAMASTLLLLATPGCRARKGLLPRGEGEAVVLVQPDAEAPEGVAIDSPGSSELEPNNTTAQAQRVYLAPWPLEPGAPMADLPEATNAVAAWSVAGQTSGPTDVDTYRLVLVPPGGLPYGSASSLDAGADGGSGSDSGSFARLSIDLVAAVGPDMAGGLTLEIRAANGGRIFQQSTSGEGVHWPNIGLIAGSDLLLVVSRTNRKKSATSSGPTTNEGAYRLSMASFVPRSGEETEPNSDPNHATWVTSTTATVEAVGYLGWKQDTDWFAFSFPSMPPESVLAIDLDLPADGSGTVSVAYDASGKVLHGYSRSAVGKLQLKGIAVPTSGPLFVRVQNTGAPILAQKYRLTLSAVNLPEGSEMEPNGTIAHAFETSASRINGFVHPAGDIDNFKICGRASMTFSVESPDHLDLEVSVADVSGMNLSTVTAPGGKTTLMSPLPATDCSFIQIREKTGKQANLLSSYLLRVVPQ